MFWNENNWISSFSSKLAIGFVWGLVSGSVLLLVVMGARLPQEIQSLSTVKGDKTGWHFSQIESSVHKLDAILSRESELLSPNSATIRMQAEIVLAHLSLISTKTNRALLSSFDTADTWYQTVEEFVDYIVQKIDRQGSLSVRDVKEIEERIKNTIPTIRSLSVAGFIVATQQEQKRRIEVTEKIKRFGLLVIFLLVVLAISSLYLSRLLRLRREKDAKLRVSAKRLAATLEASLDGVIVVDITGRIIDFNNAASRVFGWTQNEIIGKFVNDTISPELGKHENWSTQHDYLTFPVIHRHSKHRFESLAKRKVGEAIPVEVTVTPLEDNSGDIFIIAFKDISDHKLARKKIMRAQVEAERANQVKTRFLQGMSHEMRTPLAVILGFLELLSIANLQKKEKKYVNSAIESGNLLLEIMNDALDFTRIETGDLSLNPQSFSLLDAVNQLAEMIEPLAQRKGLSLTIDFDNELNHHFHTDKLRLLQILTNLLTNAVKYTDSGSIMIAVTGIEEGDETSIIFRITDTGQGIPTDQQESIFDYFVTSSSVSTEHSIRSDGLGLPLSRKLARLLGGKISLQSKVGKGSTFTLEVPMTKGRRASRTVVETHTTNTICRSVLIVDDSLQNIELLTEYLNHSNNSVTRAHDSQEAVDIASVTAFDLIIMDIHMPLLNGIEATRSIKNGKGPNRNTFILGLTAHNPALIRLESKAAGMNAVLGKPIKLIELQKVMQGLGAVETTTHVNAQPSTAD